MAFFNHITWRRLANNGLEKPAKTIFEKNRRNHNVAWHLSSSMFASIRNGTTTKLLTIIWRVPIGNRFWSGAIFASINWRMIESG
jgi:hypothetical protein